MTLDRKWEKFTGGPATSMRRAADAMRVTINRSGMIYLNKKAYEAFGQPAAVSIYYSREDDAIALEPGYPRSEESFPVRRSQGGASIHASSFCRHHNIRIPTTERFIRPDLTNEGQLILELRQTVTVGGIRKRSKKNNNV
jgi:hypothetical protein